MVFVKERTMISIDTLIGSKAWPFRTRKQYALLRKTIPSEIQTLSSYLPSVHARLRPGALDQEQDESTSSTDPEEQHGQRPVLCADPLVQKVRTGALDQLGDPEKSD